MSKKTLIYSFLFIIFTTFIVWIFIPITLKTTKDLWTFYDRNGEILFSEKAFLPENAQDQKIPDFFIESLLEIEDQHFYDHIGVDFFSIIRATKQNIQSKKIVSGASTITMQLARLSFLENQNRRSIFYKISQIFYALKINLYYTKSEILEEYLKRVNFGTGATGLKSASYRYFGKIPENLTVGESAMLIGIIPNPSKFNPLVHPKSAHIRKNHVLKILQKKNIISDADFKFWENQKIQLNPQVRGEINAPHFVFWVRSKIPEILPENNKELHIYTTLDLKTYKQVLKIAQNEIKINSKKNNAHNASAVAIDLKTQEIIAMLGGVNFFDKKIDGAVNIVTSKRSSGSTLKPFLFATALDFGFSPLDSLEDEYRGYITEKGTYAPRNFNIISENGLVRFREALANSYNLSAVNLLDKIGINIFLSTLNKSGLDIKKNNESMGLSSILGAGEVTHLDLISAYTIFPHKGKKFPINFLQKIENKDRKILWEKPEKKELFQKIFTKNTSEWVTHVLSDKEAKWKEYGRGNVLEVDRPAAVKTGTSQNFRDNWVMGYSPDIALGVWVGNSDGTPLYTSSGVSGAGPIWNKIFRYLHKNISEKKFNYTGDRQSVTVCRRAFDDIANCPEKIQEFLTEDEIEAFSEKQRHHQIKTPTPEIAFPHHGDIFHKDSELLIETRYITSTEIKYFIDNQETTPHIKKLNKKSHEIWAEYQQDNIWQKTPKIKIFVE